MATRFYIPRWDGRATPVSVSAGAQWDQTANSFSAATGVLAATTKGATAPTSTTSSNFTKSSATTPWNTLQMQAVSDTLDVAQVINGTFSAVFRIGETSTAANISLQVVLRVVSQDGTTQRGVLYAGHTTATSGTANVLGQEAPTTAATRIIPAGTTLTEVSAQAGDRIVVEIGTRATTTGTTTAGFIQFGDNSGTADHNLNAGNTSSLVPWVELTPTLTFGTPVVGGDVIIDDFDDNSISADWDNWGGGNVVETGQQLVLTTGTSAFAYYGIQRVDAVTITGQFIGTRVVSAGNQALLGYGAYPVSLVFSASNEAYWVIVSGTAFAYTNVGGAFTERGAVTHADDRIYVVGEDSDDIIWKYSDDDGATWSTAATLADPFSGDRSVHPYIMTGTDQANGSTTTFVVDDFGWYDTSSSAAEVTGTITTTLGALTATVAATVSHPGSIATVLGGLTAAASGSRTTSATVATVLGGLTASGVGSVSHPGTVATVLGGLTAAAAGSRTTAATIATVLGGLTTTASASVSHPATATTVLGSLSATAAGSRTTAATVATVLGGLTATAAGSRTTAATATTVLGSLSATAAGTVTSPGAGAATTVFGALSATAAGSRTTAAVITTVFGGLSATVAGTVTSQGAGSITTVFGAFSATAAGSRTTAAVITTVLGALSATAVGGEEVAITPRPDLGTTARPADGTTSRPADGTTARPDLGTTTRP